MVAIGLITVSSYNLVITTMATQRRLHNEHEENNRSSTISTKPVKEDEMAYLKYLKANSVPPPNNTMKFETVSLDNRVSTFKNFICTR